MKLKDYISDYEYDLMSDVELDCLDCDYQYEQYKKQELAKTRLADYSFDSRIAMNGMTYRQIDDLNNKMFELEWRS